MVKLPTYVLITPARNEAQFIELTMKSMLAQISIGGLFSEPPNRIRFKSSAKTIL